MMEDITPLHWLLAVLYDRHGASKSAVLADYTITILEDPEATPNSLYLDLHQVLKKHTPRHLMWLIPIWNRLRQNVDPLLLCNEYNITEEDYNQINENKLPFLDRQVVFSSVSVPPFISISQTFLKVDDVDLPKTILPIASSVSIPSVPRFSSTTVDPSLAKREQLEAAAERAKITLCKFHPNCTRPNCYFFHPTEEEAASLISSSFQEKRQCRYFPNCLRRDKCPYFHPPCKYGRSCTNRTYCSYTHPKTPCKLFGLMQCDKGDACSFNHNPACPYGHHCTLVGCERSHFAPSELIPVPFTLSRAGGDFSSQELSLGSQEHMLSQKS
ncbi:hypothetical protein RCL1_004032 [Eukaryota sp. TZLM3-RCL]